MLSRVNCLLIWFYLCYGSFIFSVCVSMFVSLFVLVLDPRLVNLI